MARNPAQPNLGFPRDEGTRTRCSAVHAALAIFASACFPDAPTIAAETGGASATSLGVSSDAVTSPEGSSGTTDSATSDSIASTSPAADSTGSSPSPCDATLDCPPGLFVCESFEPPFAFDDVPWRGPTDVAFSSPPVLDDDAQCGNVSLACTVAASDPLLSQLEAGVPAAGALRQPVRVQASYSIDPQCAQQPIRLLTARVNRLQGGSWYALEVLVADQALTVRATNDEGTTTDVPVMLEFPSQGAWTTLTLDMDFALQPPGARVRFGATDMVLPALPPLGEGAVFDQSVDIVIGAATDGSAFDGMCTVRVDDVLFGPAELAVWGE